MSTIKLSSGIEVTCRPVSDTLIEKAISRVAKEYRERGEPIDPPTYDIKMKFGSEEAVETYPHDETTLEVKPEEILSEVNGDIAAATDLAEQRTEANRRSWKKHKEALAKLKGEESTIRAKVMILSGLDFEMPGDDTWMDAQKFMGVEIPDDPQELRYHYLTTEVMRSMNDFMAVTQEITRLSYEGFVSEEDIASAMNLFRGRMDRGRRKRNKAGGTEAASQPLEAQPEAHLPENSQGMGLDAQPMEQPPAGGQGGDDSPRPGSGLDAG